MLVVVRFWLSCMRTTQAPSYCSALKPLTSRFCPVGLTSNLELAMRITQPSSVFCFGSSRCASGLAASCGAPAGTGQPCTGHSVYSLRRSFTDQSSLRSRRAMVVSPGPPMRRVIRKPLNLPVPLVSCSSRRMSERT